MGKDGIFQCRLHFREPLLDPEECSLSSVRGRQVGLIEVMLQSSPTLRYKAAMPSVPQWYESTEYLWSFCRLQAQHTHVALPATR